MLESKTSKIMIACQLHLHSKVDIRILTEQRFWFKGMNTPSGGGNASGAAWNDSMDLYCTEHTERQWQRHPKRCH